MKKISTFLVSFFITVMAIAKPSFQSKITVTTVGNTQIKVVIDNDRFDRFDNSYQANGGSLVVTDLGLGYHTIKIYQSRRDQQNGNGGWGFGRRDRYENYRLVYTNSIYIRPMTHIDIVVNRFGKVLVDEQVFNNRGYCDSDWDNDDNNDRGRGRDWDRNRDRGDWDRNSDRDNDRNHGRDFNPRMGAAMNVDQYNLARQTIQRESFDKGKLAIAYQVLSNNFVTSAQTKELMMLFSFDEGKLDFAKAAYRKTVDKENFFIVYDVFSFSNSKEQLADFIRTSRN